MPEGLTLNGLSLNNGTTHILTALQLPIPAKKPEWVEGSDADGAVLMRNPLVENGTLVATLDLYTASKDAANAAIGAIVDQLEEADLNPAGIPVVWTPVNGTKSLTFYALSGEVTELPMDTKAVDSNVPTVTITLKCRPGGYGALVTGPSQTTAGPTVQLTVPDVPGDMPTDEAYIVITDQSSQTRRHVEWGAEWLHYNASAALELDSDSLTVSGYSGAQTTFGVGGIMYDPNASGNNFIQTTAYPGAWTSMCSTGSQAHVGTFRVKARVVGTGARAYLRLAWKVGDGGLTLNDEVYADAPSANYNTREVDLGLVTIPAASAGTQSWEGIIQIKSGYTTATTTFGLDYLVLVPVEAGYGRARGQTISAAGTVSAADSFNQVAGALNGKTLGGTWATSGTSGTDFQTTGSNVTRNAGTEALWAGRFAIAGSTNFTDVTVRLDATGYNIAGSDRGISGVIVRWVDASNWFGVFTNPGWATGDPALDPFNHALVAVKNVSGSKTLVAYADTTVPSGVGGTGISFTWEASASATGGFTATLTSSHAANVTVSGTDTTLVTGGTLDDGKPGFYSERTAGPNTYTFDNFLVSSAPALVPAIYSGRTFEVTGADARRQNSAGTLYGRPASYRGSRFVLNPEGSAGRSTRILAKAWRNDVDLAAEATPVTDSLKCQVFYRPRYSVVPR
jgi:hypothetical protein